jgi:hypothetical protein
MKSIEECQFRSGQILAELQREGFQPHDVTQTALLLAAYVISTHTKAHHKALNAAITFLTEWTNGEPLN